MVLFPFHPVCSFHLASKLWLISLVLPENCFCPHQCQCSKAFVLYELWLNNWKGNINLLDSNLINSPDGLNCPVVKWVVHKVLSALSVSTGVLEITPLYLCPLHVMTWVKGVHTKYKNYEVLIIFIILWKERIPHHTYNDNHEVWITFRTIFLANER